MFDLQIVFYVKIVNLLDAECSTFSGQLLGAKMKLFDILVSWCGVNFLKVIKLVRVSNKSVEYFANPRRKLFKIS